MWIRHVACASVFALLLSGPVSAADKPEDLGQAAAESWLKLVDTGNFDASWEQAATLFKGAVTKEQWNQALAGVRSPLGKVMSRRERLIPEPDSP